MMGVLLLIALGAMLGWLAALIQSIEPTGDVMANVGIGSASALVVGGLVGRGSLLGPLAVDTIAYSAAAAIAVLALWSFVRNASFR